MTSSRRGYVGTGTRPPSRRGRVVIEKDLVASPEKVWELCTTRKGIESWWGPDRFRVEVLELDLKVGGRLVYEMIATDPEIESDLKNLNVASRSRVWAEFTEIEPPRKLVYRHHVDFIDGVPEYDVLHTLTLTATSAGVRMRLQMSPMHNAEWSERAAEGWRQELAKLVVQLRAGEAISPPLRKSPAGEGA